MKTDEKIKELTRRIEKKSTALLHNIRSQIDRKYKDLCESSDRSMKREKQGLRRKAEKLLRRMEEKVQEQSGSIARMRRRVSRIDAMLKKAESSVASSKVDGMKAEVERMVKEQSKRYDKLRTDQKRIYRSELERLKGTGEVLVGQNSEKLKGLIN